ncbi:MAG: alpha/beta hydrolase [Rhodospirillales bacterium]|jgi:pimeloyl-ACP methyl ester carboxylesterase|nr:alpha/beta hydrolase [Rhodospirillales bacterium]
MEFLTIQGRRLEFETIAAADPSAPTLVFLHEGLGSLALWKDFPAKVAAATGCGALVYSRYGYGWSDPLEAPRRADYMHDEALLALPELLDAVRIAVPVLIGHSDGASIALLHAGGTHRIVSGLVLMAPHVFIEEMTIRSIAQAKTVFDTSDLGERLRRYHRDPENAFRGWNDIWLDPEFRDWNIESCLSAVRCPVLLLQGADDEYGSLAQLDAIERGVAGPVERLVLADCRHSPQRDQEAATVEAIMQFVGVLDA